MPSGATSRALSKAAAEAGVCVVGGTVPERCGDKLYNTCTVWDECGKLLAQHRKVAITLILFFVCLFFIEQEKVFRIIIFLFTSCCTCV